MTTIARHEDAEADGTLGDFTISRRTNTEYERLALRKAVNLSDGHARHGKLSEQKLLIRNASEWLDDALSRPQSDIEEEFLNAFFSCAGQTVSAGEFGTFLSYSSSCAIKMAAQYCRLHGLRVFLLEPCFDNIRHILQTERVPIVSLREEDLRRGELQSRWFSSRSAIWLVMPNNPTGFLLRTAGFRRLITRAAETKTTLIVDFCFRFFAHELNSWDQYAAFKRSNARFITIEDTGKTWSLGDTKVGVTVCSSECRSTMHRLHDELLLNVSPWQLTLLTSMIRHSIARGIDRTIIAGIEKNRRLIECLLKARLIRRVSRHYHNVPMEFFELPAGVPATEFWRRLRLRGVDVLPAHNYYWSRPNEGQSRFRVPLARPHGDFEHAIPIIEHTLRELRRK